uniref:Secreted protein n=1 Tax=Oryza brachyantha TaxID=4533 RepID=J3N8X7_ORYBR
MEASLRCLLRPVLFALVPAHRAGTTADGDRAHHAENRVTVHPVQAENENTASDVSAAPGGHASAKRWESLKSGQALRF